MGAIPILLIAWPALAAAVLPCIRDRRVRGAAVYGAAAGVMALATALLAAWMAGGGGGSSCTPRPNWPTTPCWRASSS